MEIMVEYLSCGCVIWLSPRAVVKGGVIDRDGIGIDFMCPRCRQHGVDVTASETRTVEAVG